MNFNNLIIKIQKMVKPIIKWIGGKTQSIKILSEYIYLDKESLYVEPFVGGGSVFLTLQPQKCIISDINPNLMCMYKTIKEKCDDLCTYLSNFILTYNDTQNMENKLELYLYLRKKFNQIKYKLSKECRTNVEISGVFILLNKLGFNGLYRENSCGEFNVPFGKKTKLVIDIDNIKVISTYLNTIDCKIECQSYEKLLDNIKSHVNDVMLYLDPPYYICEQSKFTEYISNENNIFVDKNAHIDLYKKINILQKNKNWHIVCSNSFAELTKSESIKHNLGIRCITVNKNINRTKANEIISYTKDSNVWKSINNYFNGISKFKTIDDEKKFIDIFRHVVMYNSKRVTNFNVGQIGEIAVKRLFSEYGVNFQKCPYKESVRPDGYIEIGNEKYIVEVKSRTYTCNGTASEKIDSIARKLHIFYKKYNCKSIIIFAAGQIFEKSGNTFLKNEDEYVKKFKLFAKNTSGIEYWISYNDLENWIKSKL